MGRLGAGRSARPGAELVPDPDGQVARGQPDPVPPAVLKGEKHAGALAGVPEYVDKPGCEPSGQTTQFRVRDMCSMTRDVRILAGVS
jgi:hypothetical protein